MRHLPAAKKGARAGRSKPLVAARNGWPDCLRLSIAATPGSKGTSCNGTAVTLGADWEWGRGAPGPVAVEL